MDSNNFKSLSIEQLKIKKEHLLFDLEKFMKDEYLSDGAVLLITPSQMILTSDLEYREHGLAVGAIYSAIYKHLKINEDDDVMWQHKVMNDGNICIQLCSGAKAISVVCIPKVISIDQYKALEIFNNKLKDAYISNKEYFDKYPLGFVDFYSDEYCDCLNNLDVMLLSIKNRIGIVNVREEYLIGDSIKNTDKIDSKNKGIK